MFTSEPRSSEPERDSPTVREGKPTVSKKIIIGAVAGATLLAGGGLAVKSWIDGEAERQVQAAIAGIQSRMPPDTTLRWGSVSAGIGGATISDVEITAKLSDGAEPAVLRAASVALSGVGGTPENPTINTLVVNEARIGGVESGLDTATLRRLELRNPDIAAIRALADGGQGGDPLRAATNDGFRIEGLKLEGSGQSLDVSSFSIGSLRAGVIADMAVSGLSASDGRKPVGVKLNRASIDGLDLNKLIAFGQVAVQGKAAGSVHSMADIGASRIEVGGLELSGPWKEPARLDSASFVARQRAGGYVTAADYAVAGLIFPLGPVMANPGAATFSALGYEAVRVDLESSYAYDPAARTLKTPVRLKVGDAFEANLSLAMTGVDPEALASNAQAGLQTAGVQALSLEWRDLSLTRRALAMQARQSGREPEVIAADLARQLPQMAALFAGNHAGIQQVAKAVGEHLIDPSKVLRIDIRSGAAGGVSMAQVVGGYHPAGLAGLLEVSARAE